MPDSIQSVYSLRKVGVVFALASGALLAGAIWWVSVDYRRPWRQWQTRHTEAMETLAHLEALADTSPTTQQPPDSEGANWQNLPLVDDLAPKNRPGRHQIRQVTLPGSGGSSISSRPIAPTDA